MDEPDMTEIVFGDLSTVDIEGVELFATGTWHGVPFTEADLDAMVTASQELPMRRPVVIDHDDKQTMLKRSGVPAAGWVENLRREGDKLLGDLKSVPEKLASLIRAGAYRTRSAEIYRQYVYGEKVYPLVFKALALLGGKMPEVKTLDDIVALYGEGAETVAFEEAGLEEFGTVEFTANLPDYLTAYIHRAFTTEADEAAMDGLLSQDERKALSAAIGDALGAFNASIDQTYPDLRFRPRYPQGEVPVYGEKEPEPEDENNDGGENVETAQYAALLGMSESATDTEVSGRITELLVAPVQAVEAFKASDEFVSLTEKAAKAETAERQMFERDRDDLFAVAQTEGRMIPAQVEGFTALYDKDPEGVKAIVASLPKLVEFGERGGTGEGQDDSVEAQAAAISKYMKENKADYETAYTAILVGEVD